MYTFVMAVIVNSVSGHLRWASTDYKDVLTIGFITLYFVIILDYKTQRSDCITFLGRVLTIFCLLGNSATD